MTEVKQLNREMNGRRSIVISVELLSQIIDICLQYQASRTSSEIDF